MNEALTEISQTYSMRLRQSAAYREQQEAGMNARNLMLVLAAAAALAGQTADVDVTLQRAIRKERVEGDLSGAIELYKKVIAGAAKNRAAAAKALLALGRVLRETGKRRGAKAYERLVNEFSDQAAPAREAQARLAAMRLKTQAKSITAQLIARGPEVDLEGRVTPDGRLYVFVDQESGNLAGARSQDRCGQTPDERSNRYGYGRCPRAYSDSLP